MIKPTVGRKVWFYPAISEWSKVRDHRQPFDATIVYVHADRMINITGSDHNGDPFKESSVTLLQDDDLKPLGGRFVVWMPYQQGQAKAQDTTKPASLIDGPLLEATIRLVQTLGDLAVEMREHWMKELQGRG